MDAKLIDRSGRTRIPSCRWPKRWGCTRPSGTGRGTPRGPSSCAAPSACAGTRRSDACRRGVGQAPDAARPRAAPRTADPRRAHGRVVVVFERHFRDAPPGDAEWVAVAFFLTHLYLRASMHRSRRCAAGADATCRDAVSGIPAGPRRSDLEDVRRHDDGGLRGGLRGHRGRVGASLPTGGTCPPPLLPNAPAAPAPTLAAALSDPARAGTSAASPPAPRDG